MKEENKKGQLSGKAALSLIVGSIIGAGLFMKPASMAAQLGSPLAMTITWLIAGFFTLCGALVIAELGVRVPTTGGLFVHFTNSYGPKTGFLYGWSAFSVINTASIAAVAFICATYLNSLLGVPDLLNPSWNSFTISIYPLGHLYPFRDFTVKLIAIIMVLLITWINSRSLQAGGIFQFFSTALNIFILLFLTILLFSSSKGTISNFYTPEMSATWNRGMAAWIPALTGAFFALDGWINIISMAGEVQSPARNIPRALILGVGICLFLYLVLNQAYLFVLPVDQMAIAKVVASDALSFAWGPKAGGLIAFLIVCCTLGCLNGNVMASARVTYAMGRDHVFPHWIGTLDQQRQVPVAALRLHGLWIILLIISGSFDMLVDMYVFVTWIAYGLAAVAVLRQSIGKGKEQPAYRAWGQPFITIIFICFCLFYLVATIYTDIVSFLSGEQPIIHAGVGLFLVLAGLPLYYYWKKKLPSSQTA
ncbi:MAG: amino acid permease [Bacteroidetes bacterium]|nr:amino acid permease [Bacteroidota bacterium]